MDAFLRRRDPGFPNALGVENMNAVNATVPFSHNMSVRMPMMAALTNDSRFLLEARQRLPGANNAKHRTMAKYFRKHEPRHARIIHSLRTHARNPGAAVAGPIPFHCYTNKNDDRNDLTKDELRKLMEINRLLGSTTSWDNMVNACADAKLIVLDDEKREDITPVQRVPRKDAATESARNASESYINTGTERIVLRRTFFGPYFALEKNMRGIRKIEDLTYVETDNPDNGSFEIGVLVPEGFDLQAAMAATKAKKRSSIPRNNHNGGTRKKKHGG